MVLNLNTLERQGMRRQVRGVADAPDPLNQSKKIC